MSPIRQRQRGSMLLIVVATIMVIALIVLVNMVGELTAAQGRRLSTSDSTLSRIQAALVSFAATHQRLPCPAASAGAVAPGWPDDINSLAAPATSTCVFPGGVVPWSALGLSKDDVTDVWGNLISYRVYDGQFGLTQANGASAINCDTDNFPRQQRVEPTTAGLCDSSTYDTLRSDFITYTTFGTTPSFDKGLNVHDFGPNPVAANVPNVAYVLIIHGPSGLGGYTSGGTRLSMPATDARDYANTQSSPSFFIRQAVSDASTPSGTTGHFDDIVYYLKIADLLRLAKQDARDWLDTLFGGNPNDSSTDPTAPDFVGTQNATIPNRDFASGDTGIDASVSFGADTSSYAGCLWFPVPIPLFDGTNTKAFRMSLEFALADNTNDVASGFTVGFLSATAASGPPTNDLCGNTLLSRAGTGNASDTNLDLDSTVGVFVGQRIRGAGITDTTLITAVSETQLNLSDNNTGVVSGTVSFSPPSVTKTGIGTAGSNYITVSNLTGIRINSLATGTGIAAGARVMTATGTTLRLTRPNTGSVSGNVTFSGPTVSTTATGSSGSNVIAIASPYGVETGMVVTGTGIASSAVISSIQPGSVELDSPLTTTGTRAVTIRPATLADIQRDLGWANGVLGSAYPDRFAVEVDTTLNTGASDPNPERTHIAADSQGVTHDGTAAASCASAASGASCDKHPSSNIFLVDGISSFHNLRIELIPDQYCLSSTGTGAAGADTVTVLSTSGLTEGMNVVGQGIGANAKIKSIDAATLITLTTPHVESFASTPLTIFGDSLTQNPAGTQGSTSLTSLDTSVLAVGMRVSGTGIAPEAEIVSIDSSSAVTVSASHSSAVSGVVTFKGRRVVAKAWVLSNAGCAADSPTCLAMKNVNSDFSVSLATNDYALQIAQCMPSPTIQSAYESLYLGLTTANRGTFGATGVNFVARRLFTN